MELPKLNTFALSFGSDPEFFLKGKDGKIVESSKYIPKEGIETPKTQFTTATSKDNSRIIRDGVQTELNLKSYTCRANLGNEIKHALTTLHTQLLVKEGIGISFTEVAVFTPEEMSTFCEESLQFGCKPSFNVYDTDAEINVNPREYPYRSAGGHIHIGDCKGNNLVKETLTKKHKLVVKLLDIFVGNTCVLLDRDPMQAERRKVYGRAGEYRRPSYGIEYRTLSNFWFKSYQIFSFVLGLCRLAVNVAIQIYIDEKKKDVVSPYNIVFKLVKKKDIIEAINNNNYDLALKNFNKLKDYICSVTNQSDFYPLNSSNMKKFEYFLSKGVDYWFKQDPLEHWLSMREGHGTGWESFLSHIKVEDATKITEQMEAECDE